jgi:hypothetical protein
VVRIEAKENGSTQEELKNSISRVACMGQIKHVSIFAFAKFRYLKWAIVLAVGALVAYIWHEPPHKPYGGTWLGYTLGTIGALLIVWLTWFGVRKRRYRSRLGTVQGWLSAHVYLGIALLVVATLHTGFEFGWNIHTLAYALMVAVVVSGIYGVVIYARVPEMMTGNMGAQTLEGIIQKISDQDRELSQAMLNLPDAVYKTYESSVKTTRLGGSFWRVLSGSDMGCPTAKAMRVVPELSKTLVGEQAQINRRAYAILAAKHELLSRARRDMRYKARLDLWLYFHVPMALALLAALAAHIIAVFIYW